jgi:DNA polymerase-3 subunit delta'
MEELIATIEADLEGRFAYAAQLATEFSQSRDAVQEKLGLFIDWWHDVLLVKAGLGDTVVNVDRTELLSAMAARLSLEEIRSCIAAVEAASAQLKQNANARLALEVFVLGLPGVSQATKVSGAAGAD